VGRIVNFYTNAWVTEAGGNHPAGILKHVLVDGGSVLNMISLSLARRIDLILRPQTDVVRKTAASTFHEIKYYVNLDVTGSGVAASIHCYCLPEQVGRSSYMLLLGQRWMKQISTGRLQQAFITSIMWPDTDTPWNLPSAQNLRIPSELL